MTSASYGGGQGVFVGGPGPEMSELCFINQIIWLYFVTLNIL